MSQSVVFMVPEVLRMEDLERLLSSLEGVLVEGVGKPRELRVRQSGLGEVARFRELGPAHEVAESYRANGLYPPSWRAGLVGRRFFQAQYSKWAPFRDFLKQQLSQWPGEIGKLQVDDDYGEIWPGPDLLRNLTADPAWDWRRSKSWHLSLASQRSIIFETLAEALRAAHPGWGTINPRLAELQWVGDFKSRRWSMPLTSVFYAFRCEEMPNEDPVLSEMLTKTFGFSVTAHACFLLRFSDLSLAKTHLATLLEVLGEKRGDVSVDFDDLVLSGEDALQWLALDPDWDWR